MAISRAYSRRSLNAALRWVCICLVLFLIFLHVSVRFWLGPAYVAMKVQQALTGFWSGPIRVGEIDFGYDGIMFVRDISFCDHAGAVVMKANAVELVLGNWPSLTSAARIVKVEHLDVRLRAEGGKLDMPVRTEQAQQAGPPSLEYMRIKNITVRAASGKSEAVFDRLYADVARAEGLYKLSIGNNKIDDTYLMKISGVFDLADGDVNMGFKFAQKTTPEEMQVLLSAAGVPAEWNCDGQIYAELAVRGRFSDTESLWPRGTVEFSDWTIRNSQRIVVSDANAVLEAAKRRLDLKKLNGVFCDGSFNGEFYLDIRQSGPTAYGANMQFKGIDMVRLTELSETSRKLSKGTGLLNLELHGDIGAPDDIRGYGEALIDDADLWRMPLAGELFSIIGASEYKLGGLSDMEFVFRLWGPRMTIARGHISNSFSAIEVEQGGKVDLNSGEFDMYVVGIPLKGLEKIIGTIPVANWFLNFKDKLVRLQIKGNWSDPTGKLIRKQPIGDVKEASLGFFVDVAKSGGNISNGLKKTLGFGKDSNEADK